MPHSLSLTGKRWILHPRALRRDPQTLVRDLLIERNVEVIPTEKPENLFPDMLRALPRIWKAVHEGEKIAIFGDYDCDGVTACAQLVRFFRRHGVEPIVRLPHRVHDGYGLKKGIVDEFAEQNVTLLITVDTGIVAMKEVDYANTLGIDIIITDHHQAQEELPNAFAILHPIANADFPTPHPSGSGVAHLLVHCLEQGDWEDRETDEALAMIGTVADLVELKGGNRRMVKRGLQSLERITEGPLADLRDRTKAQTSIDVAFRIAPRINAAGRMDSPLLALTALLNGGEALQKLDELNEQRQMHTQELYEKVLREVDTKCPLLFAASDQFHPGIVGLLAGKLTEKYGKPSCAVHITGDECTASLRSPPCYHITDGLARIADCLTTFGGHAMAAGCSFALSSLEAVKQKLELDIIAHTSIDELFPYVLIDAALSPENITLDLLEELKTLEPYGQGNPEPRFLLRGVKLTDTRTVGSDESHLQCRVSRLKAIGFNLSAMIEHCSKPLDLVCRLELDTWNGKRQPQLVIEDLMASEETRDKIQETNKSQVSNSK